MFEPNAVPVPDQPLAERLLRVAMQGYVSDNDPHVIAEAQAEIERLREALCWFLNGGIPIADVTREEHALVVEARRRAGLA